MPGVLETEEALATGPSDGYTIIKGQKRTFP